MAVGSNPFLNVLGTPGTPIFAELVIKGHAVEADGTSQAFYNIIHLTRVSGLGAGTEAQLSTAVQALVNTALSAALSDTYVADAVTVRFMDNPTRAAVSTANGIVGAITGDRLPSFNSVVTRKLSNTRGRSFKGSNHWGPIAETDTTLDQLNAGAITRWSAVAGALSAMFAGVASGGDTWLPIVLSTTLSNLVANPSVFSGAMWQQTLLNTVIGTMRRRKQGVGV